MNTTQSVFLPGIMAVMIALSNTGAIQRCESIPFSYIIAPEENKIMYKLSLFFSATPKTNMRISCLYSEKCVQLTQKRKKAFAAALAKLSKPANRINF